MARVVSDVEYKKYKDGPIRGACSSHYWARLFPFAFVFLNRVSGHQASALSVQAFRTDNSDSVG